MIVFIVKMLTAMFAGFFLSVLFVAGMPWYYFAGFAFVVGAGVLFLKQPMKFLLYLLLFRAVIDPLLINVRFSVGGVDLGFGGSLSLLLIAGAILAMVSSKRGRFVFQPISLMWLIFCLINTAAFFYSADGGAATKTLIRYYSVFSIFILSFIYIESEKDALALIRAVLYSGVWTVLGGVIYFFAKGKEGGRFAATLGHPNILAFYLLILLGCLLVNSGVTTQKWKQWVLYILFFAALVFTKTRSGWLAFIIMFIFYAGVFKRKLFLPGLGLILLLGFTPFVQHHIENIFTVNSSGISVNVNSSLGWRLEKWSYIWQAFLQAPYKGHGINAAVKYGNDALGAHNDYLRFLVETGIFGMFFAFLPYFYILCIALSDIRKNGVPQVRKNLALFIVIFVPSFLIMSISENLAGYIVIHWYLWAISGRSQQRLLLPLLR